MTISEQIRMRREDIESKIEKFMQDYAKNKAYLMSNLHALQNECPHENKSPSFDHSGDYIECEDCGARVYD